jgi:hypothetical protein
MRGATAARVAIGLAAFGLGLAVVSSGIAVRTERDNPARAAALFPSDARIAVAALQAAGAAGAADAPGAKRLARRALAHDTTIPAAIEVRALEARSAGDTKREARLFELSDAISRRSLATRIWLIQRSVDGGDVAGALRHFDIALRTSSAAPALLFPVLARAAEDPALAAPIARLLDRPQEWGVMFLNYALSENGSPVAAARLILLMRDRSTVRTNGVDQTLVAALVSRQSFGLARQVHDAYRVGEPGGLVADSDFSPSSTVFPFGWLFTQRGELSAVRGVANGAPALAYLSLRGRQGLAATQVLTLPPGRYRLSTTTAIPATDAAAQPFWTLACIEPGGAPIATLRQPGVAAAVGQVEFEVPGTCEAQWLALRLPVSDVAEQSGAISSVRVESAPLSR